MAAGTSSQFSIPIYRLSMQGTAVDRMEPIHFSSQGQRGARLATPPALSSGEVAKAMLWLPLPTHHPFDLHSSWVSPALQNPSSCVGIQQSEPLPLQDPEGPTRWNGGHYLDSLTLCLLFMERRQGTRGVGSGPSLSQLTRCVTLNSLFTSVGLHCLI